MDGFATKLILAVVAGIVAAVLTSICALLIPIIPIVPWFLFLWAITFWWII